MQLIVLVPLFLLNRAVWVIPDLGRPVWAMSLVVLVPPFPLDGAVWVIIDTLFRFSLFV
jgi:hypothetical protein